MSFFYMLENHAMVPVNVTIPYLVSAQTNTQQKPAR